MAKRYPQNKKRRTSPQAYSEMLLIGLPVFKPRYPKYCASCRTFRVEIKLKTGKHRR